MRRRQPLRICFPPDRTEWMRRSQRSGTMGRSPPRAVDEATLSGRPRGRPAGVALGGRGGRSLSHDLSDSDAELARGETVETSPATPARNTMGRQR